MDSNNGVVLVGLGPGNPDWITREAWDWIQSVPEICLRTRNHPAVSNFPQKIKINAFDELLDQDETASEGVNQVAERVLELARRPGGVTYAVPGHPFIGEATVPEIAQRARKAGLPVRVIPGVSFVDAVCAALEVDALPHTAVADGLTLGCSHHPAFPPSAPAIIANLGSRKIAQDVKRVLGEVYPPDHAVRLVHQVSTRQQLVEEVTLEQIDASDHLGPLSALYLPTLAEDASLEAFQEIVAHLRAPDGCPWDRKQTHDTLRKYLLEETYETINELDAGNVKGMEEEFGDLLLQIVLHAQIAREAGEFTMADILKGINRKIVYRHPHVFGEVKVTGVDGVLVNWEKLKAEERKAKGEEEEKGLLDGVPLILPALTQAQEIQDRAARVNFDWSSIDGVWDKVQEEIEEVRQAENPEERAKELGDLLFAVVNLTRWCKVDAESALRETNHKFRRRFSFIEKRVREQGLSLSNMSLKELDVYWDEAKRLER